MDPVHSSFESRWRRRFSDYARDHDDDAGIAGWSESGLATRVRQFAQAFSRDVAGERWLDAGCGAGTYSRWLAARGARVIGVDYSLPSVAKARARVAGATCFLAGDATRLPIRPGSVDGALCFGVTQALSASEAIAIELTAATRPGGEVWIDALNARCMVHLAAEARRRLSGAPRHLRYERVGALKAALGAAGLHDLRVIWLPMFPARWAFLQPLVENRLARAVMRALPPLASIVSHSFIVRGVKPLGA
jgi:SAM-dependent methyltransferase